MPPTTNAVIRATSTSCPGRASFPWWITLVKKSCEKLVLALIVRPATTGKDRGEGDRRDKCKKDIAAERLREQRGGHVVAGDFPPA